MSEPFPSLPPGGRTTPRRSADIGGRILAVLCWFAFLCALLVLAAASIVRFENLTEAARRHALEDDLRTAADDVSGLVDELAAGSTPASAGISSMRVASLELVARIPPGPIGDDLHFEWIRVATGLDTVRADWARIHELRTGIEELRADGRTLADATAQLANAFQAGNPGPNGQASAEMLSFISLLFLQEVRGLSLLETSGLDRAEVLLGLFGRTRESLASETPGQPAVLDLHANLAAVDERLGASRTRVEEVRRTAREFSPVARALRQIAEATGRSAALLPEFARLGDTPPSILGIRLDDWLVRSAVIAFAALMGLVWRRHRLLRSERSTLERAWAESTASDWRARALLRDFVRAVDAVGRRRSEKRSREAEDLESTAQEAVGVLPAIVARRVRLTTALLSARGMLRRNVSAARDAALGRLVGEPGHFTAEPLVELDATFREATLFGMAAVVREIRAIMSERSPERRTIDPTIGPEGTRDVVARGFDLLEWCLERVLSGDEEELAALIYLIDDLRTLRGRGPFSAALDFNPPLGDRDVTRSRNDPVVTAEAARVLPTFRKGLEDWAGAGTDGSAASKLIRGSVAVLAQSAQVRNAADRGFWNAAAAFCAALGEGAIPSGPAVRRIVKDIEGEFVRTAEGESGTPPPEILFRELLVYVALTESGHEDVQRVRTHFGLDRHPIAIPEGPVEPEPDDDERGSNVSADIIQQLEGLRAAIDRINTPTEGPSETPKGR